jgi:hypothetical protein
VGIILKLFVKELVERTWIGFIWRRVGTGGGLFLNREMSLQIA